MKLIPGMFPRAFQTAPTDLTLDLLIGQMRHRQHQLVQNAAWFNAKGERIGFGDLSFLDIRSISRLIDEGEFFVLCGEREAHKLFLGTIRVAERCEYIIGHNKLVMINSWGDTETTKTQGPLEFELISQEDAYKLLLTSTSLETDAERELREFMDDSDHLDGIPGTALDLTNRRLESSSIDRRAQFVALEDDFDCMEVDDGIHRRC